MQNLTAENISSRVMEADIDYTVARKFTNSLTHKAKERIARYTPKLDTILWYVVLLPAAGFWHLFALGFLSKTFGHIFL